MTANVVFREALSRARHIGGKPAGRLQGDRLMRKSLFICIAVMSCMASAQAQSAGEILAKVSSVYAGCRSYSDEGTSKTGASIGRGRHSYFRTSFDRSGKFRFQLWLNADKPGSQEPWVVWKNGDRIGAQGISSIGVNRWRFDTALSRIAAFSAGSSVAIPQLLLPDEFRVVQFFSLIADARVGGDEKINGRQAFRLEGTMAGLPITLWIDKSEYLILKSYRQVNIGNRHEESTVQYKPKLNANIPPEDLTMTQSVDQVMADVSNSDSIVRLPPGDLTSPPRLGRFGSSLSRAEPAGGTSARPTDDEDVVRVETNLVVCPVLVLDAEGKIVRGLTPADFVVKEDDKLQEVATISLGDNQDVPRSIVLVIDYSGSQLPYIRTSIESAKMLVDKLNPKDRMAIVTDDVQVLVDFTSDKEKLKRQLETLKASALSGMIGASEQYDALLASLSELFGREDVRPIIIFQTDGDQLEALNGSDSRNADPYWLPRKYSLQDILTATEKTRTTVYSVISGIKFAGVPDAELPLRAQQAWENQQQATNELLKARNIPVPKNDPIVLPEGFFETFGSNWQKRQMALMGLAKYTGTIPEFLERPSQADEIYTRILTDIDRRYVIGYYPTNRARDGRRRKISIEVRDHPEYTVWGQKSYFARKEE
jgi:VWFA-related protein